MPQAMNPVPWLRPEMQHIDRAFREQVASDPLGAVRAYFELPDVKSRHGYYINTDDSRMLSPDYRADRSLADATQAGASAVSAMALEYALRRAAEESPGGLFLVSGGGAGSGKSTVLKYLAEGETGRPGERVQPLLEPSVTWDATARDYKRTAGFVQLALDLGLEPTFVFVDVPLEKAWNRAIDRASDMEKKMVAEGLPPTGRGVPMKDFAMTHAGNLENILLILDRFAEPIRQGKMKVYLVDNKVNEMGRQTTYQTPESIRDYLTRNPRAFTGRSKNLGILERILRLKTREGVISPATAKGFE